MGQHAASTVSLFYYDKWATSETGNVFCSETSKTIKHI